MDSIGEIAAVYGHLKWNEQAMLKADMMNARDRWLPVSPEALAEKCEQIGLTTKETAEILDWLKKIKLGRRLIPQKGYRDFRFRTPVDPVVPVSSSPPRFSRNW